MPSNQAIHQEALERDALVTKKSRKQRQKEEQLQVRQPVQEPVETEETLEEPEAEVDLDVEAFEAIDFDDLRGVW